MSQLMASAMSLSLSGSGTRVLRGVAVGVDVDIVPVDLDRIVGQRRMLRVDSLAGPHVELPEVDGTRQRRAVEQSLGQVALLVRALHLGGPHLAAGKVHHED